MAEPRAAREAAWGRVSDRAGDVSGVPPVVGAISWRSTSAPRRLCGAGVPGKPQVANGSMLSVRQGDTSRRDSRDRRMHEMLHGRCREEEAVSVFPRARCPTCKQPVRARTVALPEPEDVGGAAPVESETAEEEGRKAERASIVRGLRERAQWLHKECMNGGTCEREEEQARWLAAAIAEGRYSS